MQTIGVDIGGQGIKAALVDVETGQFVGERYRLPTPADGKPGPMAKTVAKVVRHLGGDGPVGCAFPAVIKDGTVWTAANIDASWIGVDAGRLFAEHTGRKQVPVLNDADVAALAEMRFGAGRDASGVVFVLTFGAGIGTAAFQDGVLMRNMELGHLLIRGKEAEHRASDSARRRDGLSWKKWASRINEYLAELERLFWPDLFIIGGGVSRKHEKLLPLLETRVDVVPAELLNDAGIVGAALAAREVA